MPSFYLFRFTNPRSPSPKHAVADEYDGQRAKAKATSIYSSPYGRDTYTSIATVVRVPVPSFLSFLPSQTLFGSPVCGSQLPRARAWAASWSGLAPRGRGRGQEQDGRARADCRQRRIRPRLGQTRRCFRQLHPSTLCRASCYCRLVPAGTNSYCAVI